MAFRSHLVIFLASTLLMIGIYSGFVGFFFFTYGNFIEQTVVKNEINILLDDFTGDLAFFGNEVDPNLMKTFSKDIKNVSPPDLSAADAQAAAKNNKLIIQAVIALGITLLFCITISILTWRFGLKKSERASIRYSDVVKKIIFLMIIVMSVEFLFFTFVVGNYRPVDPNDIKRNIVKSLISYAQTPEAS